MALLSRQVILQYDVPGPDLWHERLVLAHICDEDYVVCTPDREVHYEQLPLLNEDLKLIRVKPSHNVLPPGVDANEVYPLPIFSAADAAALRLEAQHVLTAEKAARGLGDAPVAPAVGSGAAFLAGTLCSG